MFLRIRFALFICGLLVSVIGNAQKITEGVFEFGYISHEITKDSVDETLTGPFIKQLTNLPKTNIYFTSDRLAIISEDPLGSISHGVIDLIENKEYTFSEISGVKSFTVSDFDSDQGSPLPLMSKFGEGKQLDKKIFGLTCKEYTAISGDVTSTLITTKDLELPEVNIFNSMVTDGGFMVSMDVADNSIGFSFKMGLKSFSPVIKDRSVISIDTTGMTNVNNFQKEFHEGLKDFAQSEAEINEKFKDEKPPVANKELIQKLIDQGILDIEIYSVSSALNEEELYDIPTLLIETSSRKKGFALLDRKEIKDRFEASNMLTESVEKLLTLEDSEWSKIEEEYKMEAITLAVIKDHLASKKTRKQIIENLDRLNYGDFSNHEIGQSYLSGRIDLKDFLGGLPFLDNLEIGTIKDDQDLFQHINTFFSNAFNRLNLDVKITGDNKVMVLENGVYKTSIDLLNVKRQSGNYQENKFEPNEELYNHLLDYVKQISKDNNQSLGFGLTRLSPPFTTKINYYSTIVEAYPPIKIDQEALFFYTTPSTTPIEESIGTSFPFHPDNIFLWEIRLGSFHLRSSSGKEYVSTKTKNKFIAYLTEHHKEFGLDDKSLSSLVEELASTIFPNKDLLLSKLPNRKLVIREDGFNPPRFPEGSNIDFKKAFPRLYKVIGDDFPATNFKYDSEADKIYFSYNGQQHTVNSGTENMVDFIKEAFNKSTTGKQLYQEIGANIFETVYYYLTPQEKKQISEIVKINF